MSFLRIFILCWNIWTSAQIPKCPEPVMNEGTDLKCPQGRKNGGRCSTYCKSGFSKPGRDFPITCRCMRTKAGIKCKFNETPVVCVRDGLRQVNPDGKMMILQPTVGSTTPSGRQIFYPGGQKPTVKAPVRNQKVNIGGFESLSTAERNGVHHTTSQKANGGFQLHITYEH